MPPLSRFLLLLALLLVQSVTAQDRPNVLMIAIDDLNDWVGCLGGHPEVLTPHIDALAERGRNFTNAHCAVPVCSPSRISVFSGVHATTHGSYELGPAYEQIPALKEVPCMQQWFKDNGYLTFAGGKVLHHGFRGRLVKALDKDFAKQKGGPRPKEQMHWPLRVWDWGPYPEDDADMYDYQNAQKAAEILAQEHEKPFFLTVGFSRPHVPLHVPPRWFDLYDPEKLTLPDAPPEDMDDVPPNFQGKMGVAPQHEEILAGNHWRSLVQAYLASISFVDHCVGEVLSGLEAGPNQENTIIVLWSDHGFHLGEKQHWAKRTLWEESTRVPLIVTGPGIEPGGCAEPASLLDLYPTLVEMCGLPENALLEGTSLTPQLNDPSAEREAPVLISSYFGIHSLRSRDWRYIRYRDGAEELYDHRTDQAERTNLADDPAHAEIKASLAAYLPTEAAPEVKPKSEYQR